MGIFGDGKADEIEALRAMVKDSEAKRKQLAQVLADERKRAESLEIELGKVRAELVEARRTVAKARDRQKSSVERANRFKARLASLSGVAEGS
jgi:CHASE3 domain sensor protein